MAGILMALLTVGILLEIPRRGRVLRLVGPYKVPHKPLIIFVLEDGFIDTHVTKLSKQSEPRSVDPGRCKSSLRIVAHMSNMDKRSLRRGGSLGPI